MYNPLLATAQGIATETAFVPGQISALIQEIGALQSALQGQLASAKSAYADLAEYNDEVSSDYSAFQTDYNAAMAALSGDEGQVTQLQNAVNAYNSALNTDNTMIDSGGGGLLVGGLLVVVGLLGEFATAGLSTSIVVGGVAMMVGGSVAFGLGSNDQDNDLVALHAAMTQLANVNSDITSLGSLKTSFSSILGQLQTTQSTLASLNTAWQELDNGIAAVISDLNNPEQFLAQLQQQDPSATPQTVSAVICAELSGANDDWTSALGTAKTILTNLGNTQYMTIQSLPTSANIQAAVTGSAP